MTCQGTGHRLTVAHWSRSIQCSGIPILGTWRKWSGKALNKCSFWRTRLVLICFEPIIHICQSILANPIETHINNAIYIWDKNTNLKITSGTRNFSMSFALMMTGERSAGKLWKPNLASHQRFLPQNVSQFKYVYDSIRPGIYHVCRGETTVFVHEPAWRGWFHQRTWGLENQPCQTIYAVYNIIMPRWKIRRTQISSWDSLQPSVTRFPTMRRWRSATSVLFWDITLKKSKSYHHITGSHRNDQWHYLQKVSYISLVQDALSSVSVSMGLNPHLRGSHLHMALVLVKPPTQLPSWSVYQSLPRHGPSLKFPL